MATNFPTAISSTCDALLGDRTGLAILASCTGTPPTTANVFQAGCVMIQTNSATGVNTVYENTGTSAAPVWTVMAANYSGVFVKDGNGTTLVRLGGSPTSSINAVITAVEVISLDTNGGQTITFSNGCSTQNITVKQGCLGAVTGCTGSSIPITTSGCLTATSSGSGLFVAKAYFSTPTTP